jgi:microcystin-dependent protein
MPNLPQFLDVAEDMSGATVALSGDSRAVLFSGLAALSQLWQWTVWPSLSADDIDYIDALLAKANWELMRPMIGEVFAYATNALPPFSLACNGASYSRTDYPDLYAVLDAAYILDADNFVVPDMRSRSPIGAGEGTGLSNYAPNETAGEETHTLSTGEMPSHYHGLFEITGLAVAPGELPVLVHDFLALRNTDTAGGGEAHNTIHPVVAVKFAIRYL